MDQGSASGKGPEVAINVDEEECARELGLQNKKRKVLHGAEGATPATDPVAGPGSPTLRRSQVLSPEYRHAINDLPRPGNWDGMEESGYESVVSSFVQKWKEVNGSGFLYLQYCCTLRIVLTSM